MVKFPAFSDDDQWAAWTSQSGAVAVWRLGTPQIFNINSPEMGDVDCGFNYNFTLSFSPTSMLVVGRETFKPFVSWNLSVPLSTGVLSAGEIGRKPVMDITPHISFSADGKWVGGLANDLKLYVWRTSEPPGLKGRPVFVDEYTKYGPSFTFGLHGSRAAAVTPD